MPNGNQYPEGVYRGWKVTERQQLDGGSHSGSDSDTEDTGRLGVLQDPRQGQLGSGMFSSYIPPPPESNLRYRRGGESRALPLG